MNEPVQQQQRAPREWVELITITNPATPIAVKVQTTATGRPLYSMEVGVLKDGRLLRHMPIYTAQDGSVASTDGDLLAQMIRTAEEAVAVDAKRKADAWAARMGGGRGREDRQDRKGRRERRGRDREDREDPRWR